MNCGYYFVFLFYRQGVFEPDLGTAIRHKIGFSFNFALYYENFREKTS
jgi:hypothetical protein